jgi:hypothetical protein
MNEENEFDDFREVTNNHGFNQTEQHIGQGEYIPVCSQCRACVLENTGQGTICDQCDSEFTLHCEADDL